MSPEAGAVTQTIDSGALRAIDRAVSRARLIVAAESAAVGAAAAAWSVTAGFLIALVLCVWRSRAASRRAVVRALERAHPRAGNLLVTAEEIDAGALSVKPEIRSRVLEDAGAVVRSLPAASAAPAGRLVWLAALAAAAWLVPGAARLAGVRHSVPASGANVSGAGQSEAAPARPPEVSVTIEPPSYTGLPATTLTNPVQLRMVETSAMTLEVRSNGRRLSLEINETKRTIAPVSPGRFIAREVVVRSGYVLVTAEDGARRLMPITVTPDALPEVRVARPGRDLVFGGGNPRISFEVRATDDYGLRSMTLRFTKLSGSGEHFEFEEGTIPLALEKADSRSWRGSTAVPLAALGLQEGDMLVYRGVASDHHPGDREASSDAFFIEISKLGVGAGDAFTLPQEETRYALSQQMLIVKTVRLDQRRGQMDAPSFSEAAQNLAVEQRMIRSEFVFMLGGEIEDEEVEAEQSVELQAGRLANRGQRDLRDATVAMSQAEKQLTDANTQAALVAQRAAVAALQRAFARDRYILRALATHSGLDAARRLTGMASETLGWRRLLSIAAPDRRTIALQDLLRGLGQAASNVQFSSAADRARLSVLAALAVRIDAKSETLRQTAADLQRLADEWETLAPDRRAHALAAAASLVAEDARRTLADGPLRFGDAR